jgi:PPOX class probable F420-dependent enzyme
VPICFVLIEQTIFVVIDQKPKREHEPLRLRRVRNIVENPRVAIVADVYDDQDWSRLGFVLVRGRGRILEPGATEHAPALAALRRKYPPYRVMALEDRPIIAVDVSSATAWGSLEP